jgi:hypothetical protein
MLPGQDLSVRLQALIGWLGNYAHVPYTKISELLFELGQIKIGEGTLVATNQRVAQAIEKPVEQLANWVKTSQPNVHVVDLIDDVFDNYRNFQVFRDRQLYSDWAKSFKAKLAHALMRWIRLSGSTAFNLLSKLRDKYDQWWYCLDHPEVPPDNNLAERALRLAVTKRKIAGGSRSLHRFADTANLLTVVQTCRFQQRSVIDFFGEALRAHVSHEGAYPSLIPFLAT